MPLWVHTGPMPLSALFRPRIMSGFNMVWQGLRALDDESWHVSVYVINVSEWSILPPACGQKAPQAGGLIGGG